MGYLSEAEAAGIWDAVERYVGAWKLASRTGNTEDFKRAVMSEDRGSVYEEVYQYVVPSRITDSHGFGEPVRWDP